MCIVHQFIFTLCCWQITREVGRARPSISVRVHKLAVVLPVTKCVSYTVERLCGQGQGDTIPVGQSILEK